MLRIMFDVALCHTAPYVSPGCISYGGFQSDIINASTVDVLFHPSAMLALKHSKSCDAVDFVSFILKMIGSNGHPGACGCCHCDDQSDVSLGRTQTVNK